MKCDPCGTTLAQTGHQNCIVKSNGHKPEHSHPSVFRDGGEDAYDAPNQVDDTGGCAELSCTAGCPVGPDLGSSTHKLRAGIEGERSECRIRQKLRGIRRHVHLIDRDMLAVILPPPAWPSFSSLPQDT